MRHADMIFRALSDPSRLAIYERLASGELPVKDLAARFEISQPAISQHLAKLLDAGLVANRCDGRMVYYRFAPDGLRPIVDWLAHYRAFWPERVSRLRNLLKEMENEQPI